MKMRQITIEAKDRTVDGEGRLYGYGSMRFQEITDATERTFMQLVREAVAAEQEWRHSPAAVLVIRFCEIEQP